ncbi:hypothetical protein D070_02655 [Bacillus velezensis]|uniref:hypothetical protein n=1 Tax=Bacillus velezensis TaxID=492670 RepID=UPI00112D4E55|nr:hypothetical protein [Bacillus velezensis]MEC1394114.1 hypothetical protein [Bacillus velezensis]
MNKFQLILEEIENRDIQYVDDLEEVFGLKKVEIPQTLVGKDFDDREIIFNIAVGYKKSVKTYFLNLRSYIIFNSGETSYDAIQFNAEELNWFYDVRNAISCTTTPSTGEINLEALPFIELEKSFTIASNKETITGKFNISRNYSHANTTPLRLHTELTLHFEETNNYDRLDKLTNAFTKVFSFLTYRKNISINQVILKKLNKDSGEYKKVGTFHLWNNTQSEEENPKNIRERMIDIELIEGNLGDLFGKILDGKIYMRHVPENSVMKTEITPARFLMATAGFEWQYDLYNSSTPNKVHKYSEQEKEIISFLEEKIISHQGRSKRYYKRIKSLVERSNITLSDEIEESLTKYNDTIDIFLRSIFCLKKDDTFDKGEVSVRIARRRNDIAHGVITNDLDESIIQDLKVIELLYYVMVLDDIGVSKEKIQYAINKLFSFKIL